VDPRIDAFFAAQKYPEFASHKPEMSPAEADAYIAASRIRQTLHHATGANASRAIRSDGIFLGSGTVAFAWGHYMSVDPVYASEFGSVIIAQKTLIKNPKTFDDIEDFQAWQSAAQLSSFSDQIKSKLSTLELLSAGHDGVHILRDNDARADSETWLAFHPKQCVSLL